MGLAQRQQEPLGLVLDDELQQSRERSVGKGYLAFAVDYVLLQVERHGLRIADILHGLGYRYTRLLAHAEEAVDGGTRGEYHGRMVEYLDPLRAELLEGDTHDTYQRLIVYLHTVFCRQIVERRLLYHRGARLRYKYFLYHSLSQKLLSHAYDNLPQECKRHDFDDAKVQNPMQN